MGALSRACAVGSMRKVSRRNKESQARPGVQRVVVAADRHGTYRAMRRCA